MKFSSLLISVKTNLSRKAGILADWVQGYDFTRGMKPEDAGLDPRCSYGYGPSGNKYLKRLLTVLKITSRDAVIDIGCGKGSGMKTMLNFSFSRVDGVELSDRIARIGIRNFKRLHADRVKIFICNAALFSAYDAYNFAYLYNPFPCQVMAQVVKRLERSVHRSPREFVIIYNNAVCHETVIAQGVFNKKGVSPDQWGNGITLYSNRDGQNSRLFWYL